MVLPLIPLEWILWSAGTFFGVLLFLWLWRRREKRRQWANDAAMLLAKFGMPDYIVGILTAYGIGNYLGEDSIVRNLRTAVERLTNTKTAVEDLFPFCLAIVSHCRQDPEKRAEITEVLGKAPVK